MHYHKVPLLCFLNAATEFILLVTVFILAGVLRAFSPIGSQFGMWDVWTFLPVAGLYALANVACYAVEGTYRTLHVKNWGKQLFLVGLTNMAGLALMATVFYTFRVNQLSRLLLVYYYLLSIVVIVGKRFAFDKAADAYVRRNDIASRTLLIGSGELAQRFYAETFRGKSPVSLRYSG